MSARVCMTGFEDAARLENGRFVGPLQVSVNLLMERLRGVNYTLVQESTIGGLTDQANNLYDGCIGSLQQNQTDIMLLPTLSFPIPGPNLEQGVADGHHRLGIISAYNRSSANVAPGTHVMDLVFGFSPGLWILTIASFFILALFLWYSMRVHGWKRTGSKKTANCVVACVLNQHSSSMDGMPEIVSVLFFYTLMTMFGYYFCFYLTSMIKTEMVVVKPPITVQNYEEIISSGRRPVWVAVFNEWLNFKNAKKGSKEKKIWDIGMRMGINQSIIPNSAPTAMGHAVHVAKLKEVVLMTDLLGKYMAREGCAFSRSKDFMPDTNCLFKFDDSARETLQGNLYNRQMDRRTMTKVDGRTQLTFEAGLLDATGRFAGLGRLFGKDFYSKHSSIEECASNVVIVPHPEFEAVDPLHYVSLFWLSFGLIWLSLYVLLFELYYKN